MWRYVQKKCAIERIVQLLLERDDGGCESQVSVKCLSGSALIVEGIGSLPCISFGRISPLSNRDLWAFKAHSSPQFLRCRLLKVLLYVCLHLRIFSPRPAPETSRSIVTVPASLYPVPSQRTALKHRYSKKHIFSVLSLLIIRYKSPVV